jgi:hypothetical protein
VSLTDGSSPSSSSGESGELLYCNAGWLPVWAEAHHTALIAEPNWNGTGARPRAGSVSMADPGQHPGDRQMATIGTDFPAALRWMDWNAGLLGARPV